MASVRHLEFEKFRFLSNFHAQYGELHLSTKFDRNLIIHGWDVEIKLFSKWRPSAVLNLGKLQFWSCDLYWRVILHLFSEFRVDRPIRRRDIAKTIFNMAFVRHLEFSKIAVLVMCPVLPCDSVFPIQISH